MIMEVASSPRPPEFSDESTQGTLTPDRDGGRLVEDLRC